MMHLLLDKDELRREIKDFRADTDGKFRIVFETLDQLLSEDKKPKNKIGYLKEKQAQYGKWVKYHKR